jgi:hypothetical protein
MEERGLPPCSSSLGRVRGVGDERERAAVHAVARESEGHGGWSDGGHRERLREKCG